MIDREEASLLGQRAQHTHPVCVVIHGGLRKQQYVQSKPSDEQLGHADGDRHVWIAGSYHAGDADDQLGGLLGGAGPILRSHCEGSVPSSYEFT